MVSAREVRASAPLVLRRTLPCTELLLASTDMHVRASLSFAALHALSEQIGVSPQTPRPVVANALAQLWTELSSHVSFQSATALTRPKTPAGGSGAWPGLITRTAISKTCAGVLPNYERPRLWSISLAMVLSKRGP